MNPARPGASIGTASRQIHAAFQLEAWPAIRDLLSDAALDDLNDSGLPFGPDDFTAGMQWNSITIDPGASASLGGNTPAPPFLGPPPPPPPESQALPVVGTMGMVLLALMLALLSAVALVRRG